MNSRPEHKNFQGEYIDFARTNARTPTAPIVQIPPHPSRNIDPEEYRNFRRARTSFTNDQIAELEREFKIASYPSRLHRLEISRRLHLEERQVKVWFQNRRSKEKKLCRLVQLFQIDDNHRDPFSEIQPLVEKEIESKPEESYREFRPNVVLCIMANTNPNVMPTITSSSAQVDLPQQGQHQEEQNNDQEIDMGEFLVFRNPKTETTIYDYDLLNCSFDQYISDSLNLDIKPTEEVDICKLHPTLVLPAGIDII